MMIFSLVAITGLEKCFITSAYLQWLCHLGERPMAREPHVLFSYFPWTLSQNRVRTIQNCSSYLHGTYKYQSTLDDMQRARTITLAFILFE